MSSFHGYAQGVSTEDEANMQEIFAAMDGAAMSPGAASEVDEKIASELESMMVSPPSPVPATTTPAVELRAQASEWVPGRGLVTTKAPAAAAPAPAAAAPATPAVPAPSNAGSSGFTRESVKARIHALVYEHKIKHGGKLDFSFKGRLALIPGVEKCINQEFAQGLELKKVLRMELRGFVAETLRPWEVNPDWYHPPTPATASAVGTAPGPGELDPERTLVLSVDPSLNVDMVRTFFAEKTSFELEAVLPAAGGSMTLVFKDQVQTDIAAAQQPFVIHGMPCAARFL